MKLLKLMRPRVVNKSYNKRGNLKNERIQVTLVQLELEFAIKTVCICHIKGETVIIPGHHLVSG